MQAEENQAIVYNTDCENNTFPLGFISPKGVKIEFIIFAPAGE